MLNALTIDLEEFFHGDNLEQYWPESEWESAPLRANHTVPLLLDALDRHGVKCTWFVLGWVAEKEPDVVKSVADAGHEIGCHTYSHQLVYEQNPDSFRQEVSRATEVVQEATGVRPTVFRAPCFSINASSLWALDIIKEFGYEVDSSLFPVARGLRRTPSLPRGPSVLENGLIEFPPTSIDTFGLRLPVAGGGYCRLMPNWLVVHLLKQVERSQVPLNFYCHPWEFDCRQPRTPIPSPLRAFRHYVGRSSFLALFDTLLSTMEWGTISEATRRHLGRVGEKVGG